MPSHLDFIETADPEVAMSLSVLLQAILFKKSKLVHPSHGLQVAAATSVDLRMVVQAAQLRLLGCIETLSKPVSYQMCSMSY